MTRERAPKVFHAIHALIQFAELSFEKIMYPLAFSPSTSVRQQVSNLIERKAHLLRLFDKQDALNSLRREESKAPVRARRTRQESPPLVVANGVYGHAGTVSYFANSEGFSLHAGKFTPLS
jgi:hypothetical protein